MLRIRQNLQNGDMEFSHAVSSRVEQTPSKTKTRVVKPLLRLQMYYGGAIALGLLGWGEQRSSRNK